MSKAIFKVPTPVNEKVREYKKDSKELKSLLNEYDEMNSDFEKVAKYFCFNPFVFDFDRAVQQVFFESIVELLSGDQMIADAIAKSPLLLSCT